MAIFNSYVKLPEGNSNWWLDNNCRSLCREARLPCPWTFFTWCWERMHSLQWLTEPCSTTPMMRWRRPSSRVRTVHWMALAGETVKIPEVSLICGLVSSRFGGYHKMAILEGKWRFKWFSRQFHSSTILTPIHKLIFTCNQMLIHSPTTYRTGPEFSQGHLRKESWDPESSRCGRDSRLWFESPDGR